MSLTNEQVAEAVLAFVNATTYAESKQIVEAHRDALLDPLAGTYLEGLLMDYKDNEAATCRLREDLELLVRCQQEGIDAAFADRLPPAAPQDSDLETLIQDVSPNRVGRFAASSPRVPGSANPSFPR